MVVWVLICDPLGFQTVFLDTQVERKGWIRLPATFHYRWRTMFCKRKKDFLKIVNNILKRFHFVSAPSERPIFLRDKISTSLHQLNLVWKPPPLGSINGEFLGYQLTYRPANFRSANKTILNINVKHLNILVRKSFLSLWRLKNVIWVWPYSVESLMIDILLA